MDLKNLTTFIHVAELGSFTKASQILGFSQSTISFQIRQLEEELQFPLFERINRTVALTQKGRDVLAYAHQVTKLTTELKSSMRSEENQPAKIRFAMSDSLCNSLLGEHFHTFRQAHPAIALKIIAAGTEEMFRLMDHNEVDAILTLESHIYNTEYVIVREEKVDTHFVAAADSPLAGQEEISLSQIVQQPFILTEKGMSYRRLLDEQLAQHSLQIQPVLEIGNAHLICDLVQQGIGISFLPDFVTEKGVAEGKLRYLKVPGVDVSIWKQLLHHKDKWITPQIGSVLQYCAEKEFSR